MDFKITKNSLMRYIGDSNSFYCRYIKEEDYDAIKLLFADWQDWPPMENIMRNGFNSWLTTRDAYESPFREGLDCFLHIVYFNSENDELVLYYSGRFKDYNKWDDILIVSPKYRGQSWMSTIIKLNSYVLWELYGCKSSHASTLTWDRPELGTWGAPFLSVRKAYKPDTLAERTITKENWEALKADTSTFNSKYKIEGTVQFEPTIGDSPISYNLGDLIK